MNKTQPKPLPWDKTRAWCPECHGSGRKPTCLNLLIIQIRGTVECRHCGGEGDIPYEPV